MNIALITIHRANNYGAVLQAYATQEALKRFGTVSILDYKNDYINKTLSLVRTGSELRSILRIGKDILRLLPRYQAISRFNQFIETNINLTPFDNTISKTIENSFDAFVSGSDQIWNPNTVSNCGKLDTFYLLTFVRHKRKFSYASSIGDYIPDKNTLLELQESLNLFTNISTREHETARMLSKLLKRTVFQMADPTLLIDRKEWSNAIRNPAPIVSNDYLIVYGLKKNVLFNSAVRSISKNLGLKVVAIDQDQFLRFHVDKHYNNIGPEQFLNLFLHARFVITNSFHGTAFSINFGIPFASVLPPTGGNRIADLLSAFSLDDRYVRDISDVRNSLTDQLDITQTESILADIRKASFMYIAESLTR